jgi:hypothetical protein
MSAPVLVLDDMAREARLDTTIRDVLDVRYDRGLPSAVTSGDTIAQLVERYGEDVVRRILDVEVGGQRGIFLDLHREGG